jgi:predicted dehydrogenase
LLVQSFFSSSALDQDRFEVYGQAGKLAVDRLAALNLEFSPAVAHGNRLGWWRQALRSLLRSPYLVDRARATSAEPSYRAALAHFASVAATNQPASPDLWDGYRSLAVVAAAEESARTGQPVAVDSSIYRGMEP